MEETDTSDPYTYTYSSASAGTHRFQAIATDNDGLTTTSNTEPVEVNAKPTVSLSVSPAEITLGQMVTLTATATDSDGSVVRVSFIRGKVFQSYPNPPTDEVTHEYTPAETGEFTFYAQAFDDDGAVTSSNNVTFNVIAAPTVVGVTLSSSAPVIALGSSVTLGAEVIGPTEVSRVEFYRNGSRVNTDTASPYSYMDTPPAVGTYSYYARAEFSDQSHSDSTAKSVEVVEFLKWEDINGDSILDQVLATLKKPDYGTNPIGVTSGSVTVNKIELFITDESTHLLDLHDITENLPVEYEEDELFVTSLKFPYQRGYTYQAQYLQGTSWVDWSPVLTSEQSVRGYILWCDFESLWRAWALIPAVFRVVKLVEASTVIGESFSEDVNGDGVNETVQNVTATPQPIGSGTGDYVRITLSFPNSVSGHYYQIQICIDGGQWTDFDDFDPIIGDGETLSIITDILETRLQLAKFRFVDLGVPKVKFDYPNKVHEKNIKTLLPWAVAKSVAKIWDSSEMIDLAYYLTPDSDVANINWTVNGTAQDSSVYDYGDIPDINEMNSFRVEAVHQYDSNLSDRMILVIVPETTQTNYNNWKNNNADTGWTDDLPKVYSTLAADRGDPEPADCDSDWWGDVRDLQNEYHPFADRQIRSEEINGHGHQACYDSSGNLIKGGLSAGTADWGYYLNPYGPNGHIDQDVLPFIWAAQLDGNPVQGTPGSTRVPDDLSHPLMYRGSNLNTYLMLRPPLTGTNNLVTQGMCVPNSNE